MIWHLIRFIMSLGMDTFYKRMSIRNRSNIPDKSPAILAVNHPNAFMDPAMLAYVCYPPKLYFLARGDVFKPGIASIVFEGLGIAPIFRMRDGGREGLKKNDETYQRVFRLLNKNEKVVIFAEGLCIQERRLRPLKKGVPRMVFNAMEEINRPDLVVIPVGVNYTDPKKFRSHLFFNVGEPIKINDMMEDYRKEPARTMNNFLKILEPKMKELIVHIDNPENDELVGWLERILWKDWAKDQNLDHTNLDHEYRISQQITAIVNKADVENKDVIETLKEKCKVYFSGLDKLKVRDWVVNPRNASKINGFTVCIRSIILFVFSPLWICGLIGNYPAYKLSQKIVDKKIKNVEFYSSFNLAIGTILMWIYYLIQFFIVKAVCGHFGWGWLAVIISFTTGKFVLYYYPFLQKTKGMLKALTNKEKIKNLQAQREEIVKLVAILNKN